MTTPSEPPPTRSTSTLAVVALVLAVVAAVLVPLGVGLVALIAAIVALACSIVSINRTEPSRGLAVAALVLSSLVILAVFLVSEGLA